MFGELGQIPAVRRHFIGSRWTPVQGVKRHNDVFLASEVTELELMSLFSRYRGKLNLRRHLSSLQSCHSFLQSNLASAADHYPARLACAARIDNFIVVK